MPGPTRLRGALASLAVSTRKVSHATVDARARNILEFVKRASDIVNIAAEEGTRDLPEDRALNRKLAGDSVVLLKNSTNLLPLSPGDIRSIALIGPNMRSAAFCGGGSAALQPYYAVTPYDGIVAQLPPGVDVRYAVGAHSHGFLPELTASDVATPEGAPGLRMRFYSDPPSVSGREVVDETVMLESIWQLMGYAHPRLDKLFFADVEADLVVPVTGDYEFGVAVYGTAKLFIDGAVVVDNETVQRDGTFHFGKGTREETAAVRLEGGRKYRLRVEFASAPACKLVKPGVVNFGGGAARLGMVRVVDDDEAIAEAVAAARACDVTVLCAGLTRDHESEGFDRRHMDLPRAVPRLFEAVLAAAPDTIVVTQSGTPFSMLPWADTARAHVHAWFGGNETGNGIADVLFGAVNPSGRLPLSFPRRIEDTPAFLNFGSERGRVTYGEGIYVGYKYYEKVLRDVLYPFG